MEGGTSIPFKGVGIMVVWLFEFKEVFLNVLAVISNAFGDGEAR